MMFWGFYVLAVLVLAYVIRSYLEKKRELLFLIFFVLFLTPSQINLESNNIAPAVFIFFFDIILQQNYNTRSLRPFVFSFPLGLILFYSAFWIRKRIFLSQGSED